MTVLLSKSYAGYAANTVVRLGVQEEASLVAQGLAATSAAAITPGAVTTTMTYGTASIAAAGSTIVITNTMFTANSKFIAYLSNAAADGTALYITRITPAAGTVTFTLNAAATAAVNIDWALVDLSGNFPQGSATI